MWPETPGLLSSVSRTAPLRTIRLDLGLNLFGRQRRCSAWRELEPHRLHLGYAGCRESFPQVLTAVENGGMPITFVDTPADLDAALSPLVSAGSTCRLVASYAREWKTKDVAMPRSLPPDQMDFHEPCTERGVRRYWSKIWNFAPDMDYTLFVQAPLGSDMAGDPLGEVGCPYVVRNFDFDYVGLLWFSDLVWRTERWVVNLDQVHETGISRITGRAARDPTSQDYADVLDAVKSAYRILLTRAMKGVFVWCEDRETKAFLRQHLFANNPT